MAHTHTLVQLKEETLQSFNAYIHEAEAGMEPSLGGSGQFLWSDAPSDRAEQVRQRQIVAQFWSGKGPAKVPHGLIHDWVGAAFAPGTAVEQVLTLVQDYENYARVYKPEVTASKLVSRSGDDFQVYLRLLKRKVITVLLDTDHQVHYHCLDQVRWACRSCTTRIGEVENAGSTKEKALPPDTGHGFLWRLNSYWRFQERDGGVYLECRAISLTRDVPLGLGWMIEPIIQKLPGESLITTLEATRRALRAEAK